MKLIKLFKACENSTAIVKFTGIIDGNWYIDPRGAKRLIEGVNYKVFTSYDEAYRHLYGIIHRELNEARNRLKDLIEKQNKLESLIEDKDKDSYQIG